MGALIALVALSWLWMVMPEGHLRLCVGCSMGRPCIRRFFMLVFFRGSSSRGWSCCVLVAKLFSLISVCKGVRLCVLVWGALLCLMYWRLSLASSCFGLLWRSLHGFYD